MLLAHYANFPLDLCVADVIATMADGNAIKLI